MIKNTSKNGEYVSILITMKQQQFRNYNARYNDVYTGDLDIE